MEIWMILIFNLEQREYAKKVLKFIGKTSKQIERELGHRKAEHFLQRVSTSQFSLPTNKTYDELIDKNNVNDMVKLLRCSLDHKSIPQ